MMTGLFFRLALVIGVLCGALMTAAMRLGTTAAPHESLLTRNTCSLPCLFGVTPGISTRTQAMPVLGSFGVSYSYFDMSTGKYQFHSSASPVSLVMYLTVGNPFLGDVRWLQLLEASSVRSLGRLGDFVLAGYEPARVFSHCQDSHRAIIALSDGRTLLQVPYELRLLPNTPILQVSTTGDDESLTRSINAFVCADVAPWQGFAATWKYLSAS